MEELHKIFSAMFEEKISRRDKDRKGFVLVILVEIRNNVFRLKYATKSF